MRQWRADERAPHPPHSCRLRFQHNLVEFWQSFRRAGFHRFSELEAVVKAVLKAKYAPAVRVSRNALLPPSVLGSSDVTDDASQRQRCMGRHVDRAQA